MTYLDPKSDIAFKKLFGNIAHKDILMSFLNSVLGRTEGNKIVDVVINDPHNIPDGEETKQSIVDVRCTDQAHHQYIIEMQVVEQKDYATRAQYYSSFALSRQLKSKGKYHTLVPVIFVGILDFNHLEGNKYITHHYILENETHIHALKHLEFHFIELTKFNKEESELETILDKWIYFIKNTIDLTAIPKKLNEEEFHEAFEILERGKLSDEEYDAYERYLDAIRCAESQLETAQEKGMAKGIAKGIVQGEARGEAKAKKTIAQSLLGILDVDTIAQTTGLTIEEVKKLKKDFQ